MPKFDQELDFDLELTLNSGQVFGFRKISDTEFRYYFDLDRDLTPIYQILASDERLKPLLALKGLRIIRQDPWECLAGFILSANNNIKRIQGIWSRLCSGSHVPSAHAVALKTEAELRKIGLGYRAPFLLETSKIAASEPDWANQIRELDYEGAKMNLVRFPGVGPKIADCVLLFGFQKYEAFPVDVWIWRVMRKLFFRNRKVSEKKVQEFARKRWGGEAGYIQQYLYHGARKGLI